MNKKPRISAQTSSETPLRADGHLTDAWLLLSIDGELPASDYALVKEHVRACWTCRARKEHFERTIEDIVDYEHALVAPDMPPSPGGRAIFMARLDQLAAELGRPSLIRRWTLAIFQTLRTVFSLRVAWVTCAVLTVVSLSYVLLQRNTPAVSASEFLQRAVEADSRPLPQISQPVTVQQLSIRVNGHKMARRIYRLAERHRQTDRLDASAREQSAAQKVFSQSSLSWDEPLSPHAYSRWHEGIADRHDLVTHLDGGLLRLDTTSSSGPIAQASLTVRTTDFHPVAENVRLRDDNTIEIAEVSYDVVSFASLDPAIFGSAARPAPLTLPAATTAATTAARTIDETELAITELQVRTALHNLGADLGEQIDVTPQPDGSVRVEGLVADDDRRRQLVASLRTIPGTQLHLETLAQAAEHAPATQPSGAAHVAVVAGTTPLLEASLKQRFSDNDQRAAYIDQTLSLTQVASARAWALNRLAERYTPEQIALLDPASRQRLAMLLADHLSALREDLNRLQSQLGQVLSASSNTSAANTPSPRFASPDTTDRTYDWRVHAHRVHSSVETVNESIAALLTGSPSSDKDSPQAIEIGLRTTLTQLQAELQMLDQQVHQQL